MRKKRSARELQRNIERLEYELLPSYWLETPTALEELATEKHNAVKWGLGCCAPELSSLHLFFRIEPDPQNPRLYLNAYSIVWPEYFGPTVEVTYLEIWTISDKLLKIEPLEFRRTVRGGDTPLISRGDLSITLY